MIYYDSLSTAINDLAAKGYTTDFNLAFDQIKCASTGICLLPSQFTIVAHHRFEGDTDPSNSSILYVIESLDQTLKGTLINAYGAYSDALSDEMIRKLSIREL
ncbi:phosphoribosylpyrophosphate synthetase [Sediminibacterium sp. KACHI17]